MGPLIKWATCAPYLLPAFGFTLQPADIPQNLHQGTGWDFRAIAAKGIAFGTSPEFLDREWRTAPSQTRLAQVRVLQFQRFTGLWRGTQGHGSSL